MANTMEFLLPSRSPSSATDSSYRSSPFSCSTETLLISQSINIVQHFNERNPMAAYSQYASSDFQYLHEVVPGSYKGMDARAAAYFMLHVCCQTLEHRAEVTKTSIEIDERLGYATVWVSLRLHDRPEGYMPDAEKVSLMYWRRGESGQWEWWKHLCLSAMPGMWRD